MARANLLLSAELERAFADAQSGKLRFVKVFIDGESFVLSGTGLVSSDPRADVSQLRDSALDAQQAAFVLLCPDTNVAALRWVLLAFVPEGVSVRDRMLYSSSRDSLKKQLGLNYFSGEFHATELSEVTWENFLEARKKQAADAPLSESERLLKEAALLERDTNVKSSAMGVVPFEITQNVRDKLRLLQDNKFDWIAMVRLARTGGLDVFGGSWICQLVETERG
jgi:twinfilin-like protein